MKDLFKNSPESTKQNYHLTKTLEICKLKLIGYNITSVELIEGETIEFAGWNITMFWS